MRVEKCCCGCTLRVGAIVIGILGLISAAFLLIYQGTMAGGYSVLLQGSTKVPAGSPLTEDEWKNYLTLSMVAAIIMTIVGAIQLIANLSLNIGIRLNKPQPVKFWVMVESIALVITVVGYIVAAVAWFTIGDLGVGAGAGTLVGGLVGSALQFYFIVVVYSFYHELLSGGPSGNNS